MITYDKKEVSFLGCPGCAYFNHEFELSCGMAYQNDNFTISQDWELPIKGFMVLSPKRHVNELCELTDDERNELFYLVNRTMEILKENKVSETFILTFEERKNIHFHVCIIPRYEWMKQLTTSISDDFNKIIKYAKNTFITQKDYDEIKLVSNIVSKNLKD